MTAPRIEKIEVYPVAGRDCMELNLSGAHGPYFTRNVVVLTHNRGYRDAGSDVRIPKFVYKNYPRLRVALSRLKRVYNEHISLVERLEESGAALIICPEKPLEVDRFGTRIDQLEALYEEGYACAERIFSQPQTQRFLAGE